MGTPEFAVPSFRAIADATDHEIVLAVCQPDRPSGRGRRLTPPPIKVEAERRGIAVFQPDKLNRERQPIAGLSPDLFVVVAFGQILSEKTLAIPKRGAINLHASLLPRHRGAAPICRAILNGDATTGCSVQQIVRACDAGDVIDYFETPIGPRETTGELTARLAEVGAQLLVKVVNDFARGPVSATPQDPARVTYAPKISKDDGRLDFGKTAPELERVIRAMTPWPGAFCFMRRNDKSQRIVVTAARVSSATEPRDPGTLAVSADGTLLVGCTGGVLEIESLKPEGKGELTAKNFVNGYRIVDGMRFFIDPERRDEERN